MDQGAPFPRINVGVFAESEEFKQAVDIASANRLMSRVRVMKTNGSVERAIGSYANNGQVPDLIIIEANTIDDAFIADLGRLGGLCPKTTNAIIVGRDNNVRAYHRLREAGTADYLVPPYSGEEIVQAIGKIYSRRDGQNGHVTAVMGAVGGAGASMVALNLADAITRVGANVLMIDMNLGFGTIALDLDETTAYDPTPMYVGEPGAVDAQKIERTLIEVNDQIRILPSPPHLSAKGWLPQPATIGRLIDESRALTPKIIIDVPTFWAPWAVEAVQSSNDVIVVTTPTVQGLKNLKILNSAIRSIGHTPYVIVNGYGIPKRPEVDIAEFQRVAVESQIFAVAFDAALFGKASSEGVMLQRAQPKAELVQILDRIADRMMGREAPRPEIVADAPKANGGSPLAGLMSRLKKR